MGKLKNKYFYGDPIRLSQVLGNFIANAIKFTPEGGDDVYIEISDCGQEQSQKTWKNVCGHQGREKMYVKMMVKDNGVGIEEEMIEEIWKVYSESRLTQARQYGGTGMGLWVVKRIAGLMKGAIECRSAGAGYGASFSFSVEMKTASQQDVECSTSEKNVANDAIYKNVRMFDFVSPKSPNSVARTIRSRSHSVSVNGLSGGQDIQISIRGPSHHQAPISNLGQTENDSPNSTSVSKSLRFDSEVKKTPHQTLKRLPPINVREKDEKQVNVETEVTNFTLASRISEDKNGDANKIDEE